MTDKEKLLALLKDFGIGYRDDGNLIACDEGMDKVGGYSMFVTHFTFNDAGKFIEIGAYE